MLLILMVQINMNFFAKTKNTLDKFIVRVTTSTFLWNEMIVSENSTLKFSDRLIIDFSSRATSNN